MKTTTSSQSSRVVYISEEPQYKRKRGSYFGYLLSSAIVGSLLFIVPYIINLRYLEGFELFIMVFAWSFISGVLGAIMARGFTGYMEKKGKSIKEILKIVLTSLLYTILMLFGFMDFLISLFDIEIYSFWTFFEATLSLKFWYLVLTLILSKLIVNLIAYVGSDFFIIGK